jgi:hypothetical protein
MLITERGEVGECYNVSAGSELSNVMVMVVRAIRATVNDVVGQSNDGGL